MATAWQKSAWPAGVWRHWLTDRGSLTRRLQSLYPGFGVARLAQRMSAPHLDEVAPLGLYPGRLALVREVLLKNGGTPLVFAHSVIPPAGLKGPWAGLAGLGNRPWAPPCSAIRASPATPWNTSGWTGAIRSIATRPSMSTRRPAPCGRGVPCSPWKTTPSW
jgi:hypothetical protein